MTYRYFQKVVLLILLFGLIAGTYRFSLKDYEEECFEYNKISKNWTYRYCNSSIRHFMVCPNFDNMCNCPKGRVVELNFSYSIDTDKCIKYHLVRKV